MYSWVGFRSVLSTDKLNSRFLMLFLTRAQSYYDCKNLQFTSRLAQRVLITKIFSPHLENDLDYHNAGVVVVNSGYDVSTLGCR
jgi:hypothetical protein